MSSNKDDGGDSDGNNNSVQSNKKELKKFKTLSFSDFLDPRQPWDLTEGIADSPMKGLFSFVPRKLKEGPWSKIAIIGLVLTLYLLISALVDVNLKNPPSNGYVQEFVLPNDAYPAYTLGWYYNIAGFFWMTGIMWMIYSFYSSFAAWISFTLWSWTIITIRHGLCALAPFVPSVRIVAEILRFPVLLSASITFVVWNFVLLPVILLYFLKDDPSRRNGFLKFAFGFRMCNVHIFNIGFATLNAVSVEPRRPLHIGDMNVAFCYIMTYLCFYYLILDRIGVHLYPIFSPRVPWVILSYGMIAGTCIGVYNFWSYMLPI